jgi:hypothetical protein
MQSRVIAGDWGLTKDFHPGLKKAIPAEIDNESHMLTIIKGNPYKFNVFKSNANGTSIVRSLPDASSTVA